MIEIPAGRGITRWQQAAPQTSQADSTGPWPSPAHGHRYDQVMAGTVARYDAIADFYDATAVKAVIDQATATLLDLAGEVAGMSVLDLACGQGRVAREL